MNLKTTDLMAASQERSGAGQTSGFAVKFAKKAAARIDVSANYTGLTFFLESSNDNANWAVTYQCQTLPNGQIGNLLQLYPVHEGYVRVRWAMSGGETRATFTVKLLRME